MKKILGFLFFAAAAAFLFLIFPEPAAAETLSGSCGRSVNYSLDTETGVLTLSGSGAMKNYALVSGSDRETTVPWWGEIGSIRSVVIGEGVTKVGNYAFSGASGLLSVSFASTVTAVGSYSFTNCASLGAAALPAGVTSLGASAFSGCTALDSFTVPDGVSAVPAYCFSGCTGLRSVVLPERLSSVGSGAFSGCAALSSLSLPEGVAEIPAFFADSCSSLSSFFIPDGVTAIGSYAFRNCAALASLTVPDSLTTVSAFPADGCPALTDVYFLGTRDAWDAISGGSRLLNGGAELHCLIRTSGACGEGLAFSFEEESGTLRISGAGAMEAYASAWNAALGKLASTAPWGEYAGRIRSLILEPGVANVSSFAFYGCTALGSVALPASAETVDGSAFRGCSALASVAFSENLRAIGPEAFFGCTALSAAVLPEGTETVGAGAFAFCSSLGALSLPDSLVRIGARAFLDCAALEALRIPAGTAEIGEFAFSGCSLSSITVADGNGSFRAAGNCLIERSTGTLLFGCRASVIPADVTAIGDYAFADCALTSVAVPASVTQIGWFAFDGSALSRAVYLGTRANWERIEIKDGNDALLRRLSCLDDPVFSGRTVIFGSSYSARYLIAKDVFDDFLAAGMTVQSFTVTANGETRDVSSAIGSGQIFTEGGIDYYWVKAEGIAAKDFETEVTFSLVCAYNGETFADTYTDSVKEALTQAAAENAGSAFADAANAALAYCKAAAEAFGKTSGATFDPVADAAGYAPIAEFTAGSGAIEICGTSILLKDELAIKFWARRGDFTGSPDDLAVKVNGVAVAAEKAENGAYFTFKIAVPVSEAKTAMTVELFANGSSVSNRCTDSVLNYALSMTGESAALGRAIKNYIHYANVYLDSLA